MVSSTDKLNIYTSPAISPDTISSQIPICTLHCVLLKLTLWGGGGRLFVHINLYTFLSTIQKNFRCALPDIPQAQQNQPLIWVITLLVKHDQAHHSNSSFSPSHDHPLILSIERKRWAAAFPASTCLGQRPQLRV